MLKIPKKILFHSIRRYQLPKHIQEHKNEKIRQKQQEKLDAAETFHRNTSGFPEKYFDENILPAIRKNPQKMNPLKISVKNYINHLKSEISMMEREFSRTQDTELLELFTPTMLKLKCAMTQYPKTEKKRFLLEKFFGGKFSTKKIFEKKVVHFH